MISRSFELADGRSHKFWSITLDGSATTVRFGLVGTAGQTQTRSYASADAAVEAFDREVEEKLKKGYEEVPPEALAELSKEKERREVVATDAPGEDGPVALAPRPRAPSLVEVSAPIVPKEKYEDTLALPAGWSPYDPRAPRAPRAARPFERGRVIDEIGRAQVFDHGAVACWWHGADFVPAMSREEAYLWLSALQATEGPSAPKDAAKLAKSAKIDLLFDERRALQLAAQIGHGASPELTAILASVIDVERLLFFLAEVVPQKGGYLADHAAFLWLGVRLYVSVEPEVRSIWLDKIDELGVDGPDGRIGTGAYLAAALGDTERVRAIVSAWPDDRFSGELAIAAQPELLVYALDSAEEIAKHLDRLKLAPRWPWQVVAALSRLGFDGLERVGEAVLHEPRPKHAELLLAPLTYARSAKVAPTMLELMLSSRAPAPARAWLEGHPVATLRGLATNLTKTGRAHDATVELLRSLTRHGHRAELESCLPDLSGAEAQRLRALVLDHKEKVYRLLDVVPDWMAPGLAEEGKKLPPWVRVRDLPALVIGDRQLDEAQMEKVLAQLAASTLDEPRALIRGLRMHADLERREQLVWKLFEAWLAEGAPTKDKWAMAALGLLGGDQAALKLAPYVRAWPGENQHQRAVLGLSVLQAIGTDAALYEVFGIAEKTKFKALKAKADEVMNAIAAARGLTREQLEDLIVPDCGLDERGERRFDFGPRGFQFVLGPDLKAAVLDEKGVRRASLPRPTQKDDPELANRATADFNLLKGQIREVVEIGGRRFETAMLTRRRYAPDEFERLFVRHPVLALLGRHVVFGGYDASGRLGAAFRLGPERRLLGVDDQPVSLAADARLGVIHPSELATEALHAWQARFEREGLTQPFRQLERAVFALEPDERSRTDLKRAAERAIPATLLIRILDGSGFLRGDGPHHVRPFPGVDVTAVIKTDPPPSGGFVAEWPDQVVRTSFVLPGVRGPEVGDVSKKLKLGEVDPIVTSELLATLSALAAKARE